MKPLRPQDIAQKVKAGRGYLIVRNSGTLADTDYERVADEIVAALNERRALLASLREAIDAARYHADRLNPDRKLPRAEWMLDAERLLKEAK